MQIKRKADEFLADRAASHAAVYDAILQLNARGYNVIFAPTTTTQFQEGGKEFPIYWVQIEHQNVKHGSSNQWTRKHGYTLQQAFADACDALGLNTVVRKYRWAKVDAEGVNNG